MFLYNSCAPGERWTVRCLSTDCGNFQTPFEFSDLRYVIQFVEVATIKQSSSEPWSSTHHYRTLLKNKPHLKTMDAWPRSSSLISFGRLMWHDLAENLGFRISLPKIVKVKWSDPYIYIYSKYVCTLQYAYIHISIYMYIYTYIHHLVEHSRR